ncbi:DUF1707 and DUF4870 domain-containing protein [Actinopolymorpha rutila]|uniref:Putative Tic20 family protein n=1 Tax=Actinopolymorpha rutila TaxID=446787 RepID=A0A852ZR86_9ACTN|nr:DUF1707 and DUF4870 domain-containing protein [Actinopolymorpha rutila]NYH91540.1 putative Tic20 family protein [Actinopolymorpha rutila]
MNAGTGFTSQHTSPQHTSPAGSLRIGDAERERAVEMLQTAYAEGRIDHTELDLRVGGALAAVDRAELAHALRGLPLPDTGAPSASGASGASGTWSTAPRVPTGRPGAVPSGTDRSLALLAHWSGVPTLFVGPLVIAATAGQRSAFVREQAVEATNFQLTFLGACIAAGILSGITFGIGAVMYVPLILAWMLLSGIAGMSSLCGNRWRYPWSVRLMK